MGSKNKLSAKKKQQEQTLTKQEYQNVEKQQELPTYYSKDGWMMLSVRSINKKSSSASMKHDEHVITIHPSDAKVMSLSNGDRVFILAFPPEKQNSYHQRGLNDQKQDGLEGNPTHPFTSICSINIIDLKSTKKKIREGETLITPKFLEERLINFLSSKTSTSDTLSNNLESNDLQTPSKKDNNAHKREHLQQSSIDSNSFKTPSPSKSKFSFSRGGGGDVMISPLLSSTKKQQDTSTKSTASTDNIITLPFLHKLSSSTANLLSNHFTFPSASMLTLQLIQQNANKIMTMKGNTMILQKLASAALYGTYLQKGDSVNIPFQGIKRTFLVCDITNMDLQRKVEMNKLNESFTGLKLSNSPNDIEKKDDDKSLNDQLGTSNRKAKNDDCMEIYNNHVSRLVKALNNKAVPDNCVSPILFGVTYKTEIIFNSPNQLDLQSKPDNFNEVPTQIFEKEVGGLSQVLHSLEEVLETPLFQPWLYQKNSSALRPPRGVLLFGPSGAGKSKLTSQLAQDLSMKAKSLKVNLSIKHVQCQSLISSSIVGENERHLSSLFPSSLSTNSTSSVSTTLIILDNIHLICPRRGGINATASTDQMASTLLSLMDGIDTASNFVILGITRTPSDLDPALRRPGRLDVEIEIPIPDDLARADILQVQLSHYIPSLKPSAEECMSLSKKAKGFTGADTLLAIKEAIRSSLLHKDKTSENESDIQVTINQLQQAIRTILPSTLRTSPQALVEIPKVKWSDIGGMEEPKSLLREAISLPFTHPEMFLKLGISPPRGVLLYGPPGCSKTLLARALATEGQMNFIAVKGPELLSKWLGESERALAGLFRRARQASPCVIFFDEMDAIAGKRGGGDSGGGERILSQLLTELDGVQQAQGGKAKNYQRVVVVGATNRPDLLDGALMRPGRMDRKIYVGVPDKLSREKILSIGLDGGKRCDADVNISSLAVENVTGGFSGAELVAICREAALFAIEEDEETTQTGKPIICMRHMMKSINGMKRQITPEMINFYAKFRNGTL